jgi:hypothetical protein
MCTWPIVLIAYLSFAIFARIRPHTIFKSNAGGGRVEAAKISCGAGGCSTETGGAEGSTEATGAEGSTEAAGGEGSTEAAWAEGAAGSGKG